MIKNQTIAFSYLLFNYAFTFLPTVLFYIDMTWNSLSGIYSHTWILDIYPPKMEIFKMTFIKHNWIYL